ncbi:MAG: PmoA family protein [Gemmataceae bacterium]|jgi:hypothetical protein|nr:PmoA family protein [Gemmataceae bacterium]
MKLSNFCLCILLSGSITFAEEIKITGGLENQSHVVVTLNLKTPVKNPEAAIGAKAIPAQATADGKSVVVLIDKIPAKETVTIHIVEGKTPPREVFVWKDPEGEKPVLEFAGKKVLEYVRPTYDKEATPPKQPLRTNPTTKVYHHLYAEDGTTRLTNGADGKFSHHRGIFYGFNRINYEGATGVDVWHCNSGESQQHVKTLTYEAGPLYGTHTVEIAWNGKDGKPFAREIRQLTVYQCPKGRLVEFQSTLSTPLEKVRLDGDPQHAGFHFRSHVLVEEKTENETYFLRPHGKGEKGKEENWANAKSPASTINRPWTAMSFVIADKRYTTVYIDHASNPKEARQSERKYGRVGTYFEYDLTKDKPLKVQYRLWVQEGEVTSEQCDDLYRSFNLPTKP